MTKKYQYNKKWRIRHPDVRYAGKKRYYQKTQNARNGRKPYMKTEVHLILDHKVPDTELSYMIGRSVQAIQMKRCNSK